MEHPPGAEHSVAAESLGSFRNFEVEVGRKRFEVRVAERGAPVAAAGAGAARKPSRPKASTSGASAGGDGTIKAPMHATVQRVLVEIGSEVEAGQALVVLEAMKMETEIPSPVAGKVEDVAVSTGQTVEGGQILCVVSG